MNNNYHKLYKQSLEQPQSFWAEAAESLHWFAPYKKVLDETNKPLYRWFVGGKFNICYNCLDRHVVAGRGEQTALIYDSPVSQTKARFSYRQLTGEVAKLAGVLVNMGVNSGDRVIIYMPMIPQVLMAMLACARIGAIHSVVFGGFAAKELAKRINDAGADFVLSASCGIEVNRIIEYKKMLDEAIELSAHKPKKCLIYQRPEQRVDLSINDLDWQTELTAAQPVECAVLDAEHPLYILYTSGTTGTPKGVLRDHAAQAVSLNWSMKYIYNTTSDDVYWSASDVGWIVGHSYIVYAPLLCGCATLMYEGKPVGTPDAGAFWRVIEEYKVNTLFTAPTAIRVIKQQDAQGELVKKYDISSLRALFLAGERSDPDTLNWSEKHLKVAVIDHWWQTETSWAIVAKPLGMSGLENVAVKHGSSTFAMPGYDVKVFDENGQTLAAGEQGNLVVKLPLPPGSLTTLWQRDEDYIKYYLSDYPGYYLAGDAGYIDEDGYIWIMGRIDDVINIAGHRLSTGAIEEILSNHPTIAEAAVFARKDDIKGELPVGLVVTNEDANIDDELLCQELVQRVRQELGAVAAFKQVAVAKRLPKTRSGKTLRAVMRKILNEEEYTIPPTIDDASVIDEISELLATLR